MRARIMTAAGLAVLLAVAGCSSNKAKTGTIGTTSSAKSSVDHITVWLQTDAKGKNWQPIVDDTNKAFEAAHPGVKVNLEFQDWDTHLTKLDATIAGKDSPDVVEFGNTETTKYMADGALADITGNKADFENSDTWLPGLTDSCTFESKLYCVPYYAGARAVIYRADMFAAAGISGPPASFDELIADCGKLMTANKANPKFSALYMPGKYWYAGLSFVIDAGGKIATNEGDTWKGALESPESVKGLENWQKLYKACSKADPTTDEGHPDQGQVMSKNGAAMIYGPSWEVGVVTDPKDGTPALADKLKTFAMPSPSGKPSLPAFLGGSDLAVMASSKAADLARDWIKIYTNTAHETDIVVKNSAIPNSTKLTALNTDPSLKPFFDAAANSWFVPTAKNWASVEKANIPQDLGAAVLSGSKSPADAAKAADAAMNDALNG